MFRKVIVRSLLAAIVVASSIGVSADVFNMPSDQTSLEMVPVGNPGNTGEQSRLASYGDSQYYGAVAYTYNIGKYDVTNAQYVAFLNAVAMTDTYGLYNAAMTSLANGGIIQNGSSGGYTYTSKAGYANMPVVAVTWYDSLRFCNWLTNGQLTGAEDNTTTERGVYTLTGKSSVNALPDHSTLTGSKYFLPTEDEWYKAAYHKNDGITGNYYLYATGANTVPVRAAPSGTPNTANYLSVVSGYDGTSSGNHLSDVGAYGGSASPYGTFDQNGNLWQWDEAGNDSSRGLRGGSFDDSADHMVSSFLYGHSPTSVGSIVGFRVAGVPEPGSITLSLAGAISLLAYAWRRRRQAA
jgi:formylglycine-generating enzyme